MGGLFVGPDEFTDLPVIVLCQHVVVGTLHCVIMPIEHAV